MHPPKLQGSPSLHCSRSSQERNACCRAELAHSLTLAPSALGRHALGMDAEARQPSASHPEFTGEEPISSCLGLNT